MTARYHGIGWLARSNDPYRAANDADGPTLTLLTHRNSEVRGLIDTYTLLHQRDDTSRERAASLVAELARRAPNVEVRTVEVPLRHPTHHEEIRTIVEPLLRDVMAGCSSHVPLVHLSPGTPAMHAVWLLLCATLPGFPAANGLVVETSPDKNSPTRAVRLDLPGSYRLYQRYVGTGAAVGRPGIEDPEQLQTPQLRTLYARAARLARLRTPVLILGERGTGKSTLAAWMRHQTPRRSEPSEDEVWQVACGEFTPDLLASELFGHAKGAFTGADGRRDGLLRSVGDGTLFLDEIADLDRHMQRQVIKVVEEGLYRPVGSDRTEATDARLLFATNHPERELHDRLDPDFLDRIGYFRLTVPPLRALPDDHRTLWRDVARRAGARAGVDLTSALTPADEAVLLQHFARHPLPGNLRDFYLVAYHLCAAVSDEGLEPAALRAALGELDARARTAGRGRHGFAGVVSCWLDDEPLDALCGAEPHVDVRAGIAAFQAWFAEEAAAAARRRGLDLRDWSGVPERTLRDWGARTNRR